MQSHLMLPVCFMSLIIAGAGPTKVLAQEMPYIPQRIGAKAQIPADRAGMTITLAVGTPYDDKAPTDDQIAATQRQMYKLAAKQCDLALETIAKECELVAFNSNINFQQRLSQSQMIVNTATLTLSVKFKDQP